MQRRRIGSTVAAIGVALLLVMALLAPGATHGPATPGYGSGAEPMTSGLLPVPPHDAAAPPFWGVGILPFIGILGAIAFLPLVPTLHHWWESNLHRLLVSLTAAAATIAYSVAVEGWSSATTAVARAGHEYVPFIILLGSLFVVTGGISIRADLRATPAVNTAIIAFGTLIASVVGTTGASMLLIRLLLDTNRERRHVAHTVIAFIFLVSNIGGSLLPIGDPPLFLGFLRGVPFDWTLKLWPEWLVMSGALLAIYYGYDLRQYRREAAQDLKRDRAQTTPLRVRGLVNLPWLALIVLSVAFVKDHLLRDVLLVSLALLSLATTPRGVRRENSFRWAPILEVAALFLGIFTAMQIPLAVLRVHGASLGLTEPWQFFWATGLLSSVLDNAPTYVVFLQTAETISTGPAEGVLPIAGGYVREDLLASVSLGAVFMGANTYIGNGPNFMVKAIAESSGVRMPTFFGFMAYSGAVLLPLFVLITLLFLR